MANKINDNLTANDSLNDLISSENFSHLNPDLQNKIITTLNENKSKEGGLLGKFLGINPINLAMHIALLICTFLIIIIGIDTIHAYFIGESINIDVLKNILPIITLSLGYIFGKGTN